MCSLQAQAVRFGKLRLVMHLGLVILIHLEILKYLIHRIQSVL
jgi:hypothetical protein